jgi:ABC-2 type transport system ATP-binding protein
MWGIMNAITVKNVSKHFSFKVHKGLKGFLSPERKEIRAVDDISFTVKKGESLAFIGPNGAGKSTTIKMLSSILQPTGGEVKVLGLEPLKQRRELAMRIGTVFGQRSQMIYNLPLTSSFELTANMYRVPPAVAKKRIAKLVEQFALQEFIGQPVRKLSLGQRMRAEVANALIHNPDIIFLDEPTIGLDIVAKRALREVIKSVNRQQGTTVFLTSHDVGDIEEVCERTMIVNHGRIMLDAKTADLKTDYLRTKAVSVVPEGTLKPLNIAGVAGIVKDGRLVFAVDTHKNSLKSFMQNVLDKIDIADITIADTPLEDIIHELYTKGKNDDSV